MATGTARRGKPTDILSNPNRNPSNPPVGRPPVSRPPVLSPPKTPPVKTPPKKAPPKLAPPKAPPMADWLKMIKNAKARILALETAQKAVKETGYQNTMDGFDLGARRQNSNGSSGLGFDFSSMIPLVLIFGLAWFFLIRKG